MEDRIQRLENLVDLLIEENSIHLELLKMHMVWIQRLFDGAKSNDEFNRHVARFMKLDLKITEIERKEMNEDLAEMADDLTNQLERISNELREVSHNLDGDGGATAGSPPPI